MLFETRFKKKKKKNPPRKGKRFGSEKNKKQNLGFVPTASLDNVSSRPRTARFARRTTRTNYAELKFDFIFRNKTFFHGAHSRATGEKPAPFSVRRIRGASTMNAHKLHNTGSEAGFRAGLLVAVRFSRTEVDYSFLARNSEK